MFVTVSFPNQDDEQRRMTYLESDRLGCVVQSSKIPLLDSLERILGDDTCDIAIVVDDAHLLSEIF